MNDRAMWRVVAARDFWVRLRDKGFVISTLITLSVLSIFILIRAFGGGPDSFDLGYVGDRTIAERVDALGERSGIRIVLDRLPDERAADVALRDGAVDAVVTGAPDAARLLVLRSVPNQLDQLVQAAAIGLRIDRVVPGGVILELSDGIDEQRVLDLARSIGEVRHFSRVRPSLAELFREVVSS